MGVIKVGISKVYAKAKERAVVHIYKKCKRMKINIPMRTVHFSSGDSTLKNTSSFKIILSSKLERQVPEKVYETVRLCVLKKISNVFPGIPKDNYCIHFCKFPHRLLRFHAIASGARADRISQGMSNSYGSPFMRACLIKPNQAFLEIYLSKKYENNIQNLVPEIRKVAAKIPFTFKLEIKPNFENPSKLT